MTFGYDINWLKVRKTHVDWLYKALTGETVWPESVANKFPAQKAYIKNRYKEMAGPDNQPAMLPHDLFVCLEGLVKDKIATKANKSPTVPRMSSPPAHLAVTQAPADPATTGEPSPPAEEDTGATTTETDTPSPAPGTSLPLALLPATPAVLDPTITRGPSLTTAVTLDDMIFTSSIDVSYVALDGTGDICQIGTYNSPAKYSLRLNAVTTPLADLQQSITSILHEGLFSNFPMPAVISWCGFNISMRQPLLELQIDGLVWHPDAKALGEIPLVHLMNGAGTWTVLLYIESQESNTGDLVPPEQSRGDTQGEECRVSACRSVSRGRDDLSVNGNLNTQPDGVRLSAFPPQYGTGQADQEDHAGEEDVKMGLGDTPASAERAKVAPASGDRTEDTPSKDAQAEEVPVAVVHVDGAQVDSGRVGDMAVNDARIDNAAVEGGRAGNTSATGAHADNPPVASGSANLDPVGDRGPSSAPPEGVAAGNTPQGDVKRKERRAPLQDASPQVQAHVAWLDHLYQEDAKVLEFSAIASENAKVNSHKAPALPKQLKRVEIFMEYCKLHCDVTPKEYGLKEYQMAPEYAEEKVDSLAMCQFFDISKTIGNQMRLIHKFLAGHRDRRATLETYVAGPGNNNTGYNALHTAVQALNKENRKRKRDEPKT